ncbi:hypothetical protein FLM48_17115 [Shewanella sp. Scap07]|uniref:hypothetical protein n=1 Tax=Shewanella sp. Scap07 TaxID=2589987 RepID=UPI0015BA385B|nr:hypothetical protein [Shewanella sp. Scap07]QLE86640.1 hypothetical protein FLM48_17115 [Shewanella sp. Scap07]
MTRPIYLRTFTQEELTLTNEETKLVLKFIFNRMPVNLIDNLTIKEFTQALLVSAIDASYSIGYVESLFRATANPTTSTQKVIQDFTKNAAKHWFKYATINDLKNVKVYVAVCNELARRFKTKFQLLATGLSNINDKQNQQIAIVLMPAIEKQLGLGQIRT